MLRWLDSCADTTLSPSLHGAAYAGDVNGPACAPPIFSIVGHLERRIDRFALGQFGRD